MSQNKLEFFKLLIEYDSIVKDKKIDDEDKDKDFKDKEPIMKTFLTYERYYDLYNSVNGCYYNVPLYSIYFGLYLE